MSTLLLVTRYSSPAAEEGRDDIEDSNPLAAEHMKEAGIHRRSVDVTLATIPPHTAPEV